MRTSWSSGWKGSCNDLLLDLANVDRPIFQETVPVRISFVNFLGTNRDEFHLWFLDCFKAGRTVDVLRIYTMQILHNVHIRGPALSTV